jgi:integrase
MTLKKVTTGSGLTKWEVRGRLGGRGSPQVTKRFDRKEDAERFRTALLREKQTGGIVVFSRATLDEHAAGWWQRWQIGKAENSVRNYKGALKRYVLPKLGHVRLTALNPPRIARFRDELLMDGKGAATARYTLAVLSAICSDAVERGAMATNPVSLIKKPAAPVQREGKALSAVEAERLCNALPSQRDVLLVRLMAYAGLRPEEALGLTWTDVRDRVLNVDKAVTHGQVKPTKTEQTRAVDLLQPLADDLLSYRKLLPVVPGPGAWVFPHPRDSSQPWSDSMYRNWRERVFTPAASQAGLDVVPYDLRRTFVSLLLACGYRRREVADQAGHSVSVMEKHYAVTIAEYRGMQLTDPSEAITEARAASDPR